MSSVTHVRPSCCKMLDFGRHALVQHLGWVHPEKSGGGVRPASQNPFPIYDENLQFSLPYYDLT